MFVIFLIAGVIRWLNAEPEEKDVEEFPKEIELQSQTSAQDDVQVTVQETIGGDEDDALSDAEGNLTTRKVPDGLALDTEEPPPPEKRNPGLVSQKSLEHPKERTPESLDQTAEDLNENRSSEGQIETQTSPQEDMEGGAEAP